MAGYKRVRELVESAYDAGQNTYSTFRKTFPFTGVVANWQDFSLVPGNPRPNYYATPQYEAAVLQAKDGIWHGGNVSPAKKYLHKISVSISGSASVTGILCDYLMYYPIIDMDSTEEQFLTNGVTLPRYTDGLGVQAFLVATNPYAGGASFWISYTNSDGVSGRNSFVTPTNTSGGISTILSYQSNANTCFIPLAQGDKGIRSIESITFASPNGGLACLVLVKPLATFSLPEVNVRTEVDYLINSPSLPQIQDGAYLNLIIGNSSNALSGNALFGELYTIWN